MSGSSFGKFFQITTWGESHGPGIGVVIDGCPAGVLLSEADVQAFLDRRKPGQSKFTTQRKESDQVEILSGVFEGRTTGASISMIVRNLDQRSHDYGNIAEVFRPGHADYTYTQKFGFRDYRGGGRSSGRETIGRVAAGAVASLILNRLGIHVTAFAKSIGPVTVTEADYRFDEISQNRLFMPNNELAKEAEGYLTQMMAGKDSAGGIIECIVQGMPVGIGEPVFDKLDAILGQAIFSIGAVKAVEFGSGMSAATSSGSMNNDGFYMENGQVQKMTNHAGGILGGMSDGSDLVLRAAFKPTPSIARAQQTVNGHGENTKLVIHGRHDPIIVPRAVVVVESMVAVTLVDMLFQNMCSRMEKICEFYKTDPRCRS